MNKVLIMAIGLMFCFSCSTDEEQHDSTISKPDQNHIKSTFEQDSSSVIKDTLNINKALDEIASRGYIIESARVNDSTYSIAGFCVDNKFCNSKYVSPEDIKAYEKSLAKVRSYYILKKIELDSKEREFTFCRVDELTYKSKKIVDEIQDNYNLCLNCKDYGPPIQAKYFENRIIIFQFFYAQVMNKYSKAQEDLDELYKYIQSWR